MDMIKLLIVDDEPISADALGDLLAETMPYLQINIAYNAAAAMQKAEQDGCDILITDIQMPGLSGLELAKRLKKNIPNLEIIFLTGFEDFSYAYEAFSQQAADYLLKTEGDDRILQSIQNIMSRMEQQERINDRITEAETRYQQMLPYYRRQLLREMLLHPEDATQEHLQAIDLQGGLVYLVVARCVETCGDIRRKLITLTSVEDILKDSLREPPLWTETMIVESDFVWMLCLGENTNATSSIFQISRKVRRQIEARVGLKLFFVVAEKAVTAKHLNSMFESVHLMLSQKVVQGETGSIINNSAAQTEPEPMDPVMVERINGAAHRVQLCLQDLQEGLWDQMKKHMQPVQRFLEDYPETSYAFEFRSTLAGALLKTLHKEKMDVDRMELRELLGTQTDGNVQIHQLANWVEKRHKVQIDITLRSVTQFVKEYLQKHLNENIGMQEISEATGYSAGYLSRLFRSQEGVTVHDYQTMLRMNLARELLLNTNLRIYEIADHCGYENATYFIKVFRNINGLTPQEYKVSQGRG